MTPFLQFRLWLRQGPVGERVGAAVATLLALTLLAWSAVPLSHEGSQDLDIEAGGRSGQVSGSGPTADSVPADGSADGPASIPPGATSTDAGEGGTQAGAANAPPSPDESVTDTCSSVRATDQGVSTTEILVALPYISLGGEAGNSTFNLRSPEDIEAIADAIVAGINAQGPVACRKLRIAKYPVNPLSPVEQQQTCQRILSAKVFAIVDFGAFLSPASRQCFVDAEVPYQSGGVNLTEARIADAYPYMYSVGSSLDRAARNWVFETASRGAFDTGRGFRKLGLLLESCNPDINRQLVDDLHKVGVTDGQMSVFTLSGCSGINSPSEMSAAVAQHRSAGVSHVFLAGNAANSPQYVRQADSIGWKPTYMTSDVGQETVPTVAKNFPDGFDGAIAITSLRTGERHSGITPTWVTRCNEWLRKANPRLTSQDEADQDPMRICDILRLFAFAANGAGPNLSRRTLVAGLPAGGRFEGALSTTVNEYQSRKLWAGDFIRAIQWHVDCRCWKVIDRDLKTGH